MLLIFQVVAVEVGQLTLTVVMVVATEATAAAWAAARCPAAADAVAAEAVAAAHPTRSGSAFFNPNL